MDCILQGGIDQDYSGNDSFTGRTNPTFQQTDGFVNYSHNTKTNNQEESFPYSHNTKTTNQEESFLDIEMHQVKLEQRENDKPQPEQQHVKSLQMTRPQSGRPSDHVAKYNVKDFNERKNKLNLQNIENTSSETTLMKNKNWDNLDDKKIFQETFEKMSLDREDNILSTASLIETGDKVQNRRKGEDCPK